MKTEYEKQQSCEYYDASDEEIKELHKKSKLLMKYYHDEQDYEKQKEILKVWFKSVGECTYIEPNFYCEFGRHITLGNRVFVNTNCTFLDTTSITIGDDTVLGCNVQLCTVEHPISPEERSEKRLLAKPISIGKNCWIGAGVIVLPGVSIGDGTTIGAGSVVTKDIPARCVAFGSPCKVVRNI